MTTTALAHRLTRNSRYIAWLISDTAKGLASALFGFAIPLIVLFVTNDPAQAGIIGAVGMAVRTLTTLLGGVLADRHQRIAMMVLGSAIGAVLAAGFMLLALGDALTFTTLLVAEVLLAARTGLFDVAGESALKEIVPSDAMGRAQAANQGRNAVLELAGGPLGGVLLAVGGWLIGAAMTVCHVIAMVTAWMLQRSADRSASRIPDDSATPARGGLDHGDDSGDTPRVAPRNARGA
ncbi:MAG: MFS transporter, partial [Microbacterium sp.]|uniref:MFS transporter n=1 Tax=Microbacterium sp. TaxID=51671 RepID=UPI003F9945B9